MSWQATAWALKQKTGLPARKLTLLAICNYADHHGLAWPSQNRLAKETEQSVDTIQRHLVRLCADGFLDIWERRRMGGHWPRRTYKINMPREEAASCGLAEPHNGAARPGRKAMRHEQSNNNYSNDHATANAPEIASQPKAASRSRKEMQDLQRRVVTKLGQGDEQQGWLLLMRLNGFQRRELEELEAVGMLDASAIARIAMPPPATVDGAP